MTPTGSSFEALWQLTPLVLLLVLAFLLIWGVNRFAFERLGLLEDNRLLRQVIVIALAGISVVLAVLLLPVGEETKGHLLSLIGLLLTAIIAMSSTTLASNAMAGLMLRSTRSFRVGDFVRIGTHFGRVTEIGLFHTEIQTSNRDLTTLPNAFIATNPATVVRHSGTVIEATISLGYDVPHDRAEELLLKAAADTGLEDAFVLILDLGNFAVTYRIAGFLSETKRLVSAGTVLRRAVLDTLHRGGIEIASPTLMTQRRLGEHERIAPQQQRATKVRQQGPLPEDIVFDKAEEAERLEQLRLERKQIAQQLKEMEAGLAELDEAGRKQAQAEMEARQRQMEDIERYLAKIEGA